MPRYIDADYVIAHCDSIIQEKFLGGTAPTSWAHAYADFKSDIEDTPTADVVPATLALWKYFKKENKAVCTNCAFERNLDADFGKAISCPNCGATTFASIEDSESKPQSNSNQVVHCKDCKYFGDEDGFLKDCNGVLFGRCNVHNHVINGKNHGWCPKEYDFCSCGERKVK